MKNVWIDGIMTVLAVIGFLTVCFFIGGLVIFLIRGKVADNKYPQCEKVIVDKHTWLRWYTISAGDTTYINMAHDPNCKYCYELFE